MAEGQTDSQLAAALAIWPDDTSLQAEVMSGYLSYVLSTAPLTRLQELSLHCTSHTCKMNEWRVPALSRKAAARLQRLHMINEFLGPGTARVYLSSDARIFRSCTQLVNLSICHAKSYQARKAAGGASYPVKEIDPAAEAAAAAKAPSSKVAAARVSPSSSGDALRRSLIAAYVPVDVQQGRQLPYSALASTRHVIESTRACAGDLMTASGCSPARLAGRDAPKQKGNWKGVVAANNAGAGDDFQLVSVIEEDLSATGRARAAAEEGGAAARSVPKGTGSKCAATRRVSVGSGGQGAGSAAGGAGSGTGGGTGIAGGGTGGAGGAGGAAAAGGRAASPAAAPAAPAAAAPAAAASLPPRPQYGQQQQGQQQQQPHKQHAPSPLSPYLQQLPPRAPPPQARTRAARPASAPTARSHAAVGCGGDGIGGSGKARRSAGSTSNQSDGLLSTGAPFKAVDPAARLYMSASIASTCKSMARGRAGRLFDTTSSNSSLFSQTTPTVTALRAASIAKAREDLQYRVLEIRSHQVISSMVDSGLLTGTLPSSPAATGRPGSAPPVPAASLADPYGGGGSGVYGGAGSHYGSSSHSFFPPRPLSALPACAGGSPGKAGSSLQRPSSAAVRPSSAAAASRAHTRPASAHLSSATGTPFLGGPTGRLRPPSAGSWAGRPALLEAAAEAAEAEKDEVVVPEGWDGSSSVGGVVKVHPFGHTVSVTH
ncbi:hypothetical protein FOA52_012172 [Chlamydomonas sp. UWO 241]|nr:hypothetical protein FOA52_012172 [Chlamydomonas sp. UWO 241]